MHSGRYSLWALGCRNTTPPTYKISLFGGNAKWDSFGISFSQDILSDGIFKSACRMGFFLFLKLDSRTRPIAKNLCNTVFSPYILPFFAVPEHCCSSTVASTSIPHWVVGLGKCHS